MSWHISGPEPRLIVSVGEAQAQFDDLVRRGVDALVAALGSPHDTEQLVGRDHQLTPVLSQDDDPPAVRSWSSSSRAHTGD